MNDLTILLGGVEMTVALQDGSTEAVKVRQLKVSQLPAYAAVVEDDAKCIALFCDRPEGWVDTLTLESALAVLEKGHELNGDFLARSAARKAALREKLVPGYREMVAKILDSRLASGAPSLPPKPD